LILPLSFDDLKIPFLKNDILSVDIGFTNIKVVHVRRKKGDAFKILNFGIGSTPPDCIGNGVISNFEEIAGNLKRIINDNHINEKNVKIVISAGSSIISKILFIEKGAGQWLEDKIRKEVELQIPLEIKANKLFYRITGEVVRERAAYHKVLITVVPNTTMENYIKLLKFLNFKPLSIEIPFSSVARFFCRGVVLVQKDKLSCEPVYTEIKQGTSAVVDLGSETTNLCILNNGALDFSRILLTGGRNLDNIIANRLGVKREVAERYKKMHGITVANTIGNEIQYIVNECIREYMGELLYNIKRSLEFYVNRCDGRKAERILFIGGGSALKGLTQFTGEIVGVPAYTLGMLDFNRIEFGKNLDKDKLRYLVNALGLAM